MKTDPSPRRNDAPPDDAARRRLLRGAVKAMAAGLPAAVTLRTGQAWAISPNCFELAAGRPLGPATPGRPGAGAGVGAGAGANDAGRGMTAQSLAISSECWVSGNPGLGLGAPGSR